MMDRVPVSSSSLSSVGYDSLDGILEVEFSNGRVYEYYLVPEALFDAILHARSPGGEFANRVKDQYRFRRVQ